MELLEILTLKGTAKILAVLAKKKQMRYSELAEVVGYSTTASRALKAMEAGSLVERRVLSEPYRPVEYSLTERGEKLSKILAELEGI